MIDPDEYRLPCDVRVLPDGGIVGKGCKLSTLIGMMERRGRWLDLLEQHGGDVKAAFAAMAAERSGFEGDEHGK